MIVFKHKGSFKNFENFLNKAPRIQYKQILDTFGREGVNALAAATPVDTGETANSWGYELKISKGSSSIIWTNSNVMNGAPIAILIQYGHGTKGGGYVQGRDYINPALREVFDRFANQAWKEITSL